MKITDLPAVMLFNNEALECTVMAVSKVACRQKLVYILTKGACLSGKQQVYLLYYNNQVISKRIDN